MGGELEMEIGLGHREPVCHSKECPLKAGGWKATQGFKIRKKKVEFVLEKFSLLGGGFRVQCHAEGR